ncbi:uncharacterized protein LOC144445810 [Glandiceps talaboti]
MLYKMFIFYVAVLVSVAAAEDESLFLDMSYSFKEGETIYWPNVEEPYTVHTVFKGETEDGYYYEANDFCAPEHGGTHLDAPAHFFKGQHRVDEVALDSLIGPAIKIDIKAKADNDVDAQLTVTDLQAWEEQYGRIPDDVIVLVYTGWGSRWPDKMSFMGTDTNDTSLLHFPGIHPDAAQWIVDNREVKAVGIDTASFDYGQSTTFDTHRILFSKNIPGLENVANLDQLPVKGATLYALPMKIYGGSGAPARIIATGWRPDIADPYKVESTSQGHVQSPYLDLTYAYKEGDTPYWPTDTPYDFDIVVRGMTDSGFYYEANSICTAEHGGTHMDAPQHFAKNTLHIHEIKLDDLIGPAIKIDIMDKADEDADSMMEVSDLEAWEEAHGRIPDDVILLVYSGWGCRWPDKKSYFGTTTADVSKLHFPGIHPDAAQWLVDNRKVKAVGIDTPSMDNGQSTTFTTHRILLEKNITGLENIANLDKIPATGATVFALPMKIYQGSGAPTRIIATGWRSDLPDPCEATQGTIHLVSNSSLLFLCLLVAVVIFVDTANIS